MDKKELIYYWVDTALRDYNTMLHLYETGDYHWSLFIGHLVIEKLIKAIYVKNVSDNPPRIHDLSRLAEKALIHTTDEQKEVLDLLTTFNINVRYPDYKHEFYKKCTKEYAWENIERIREMKEWLLSLLQE
nr:MAG: DNA-binding protein [Caldicoprobacter oshimai]